MCFVLSHSKASVVDVVLDRNAIFYNKTRFRFAFSNLTETLFIFIPSENVQLRVRIRSEHHHIVLHRFDAQLLPSLIKSPVAFLDKLLDC